jgi:hypothetical protein
MGALTRDLGITAVRLKRRPAYPLVAVLVLSIGLTAVIGVFAYLSAFRQPFPGADAEGLHRLMESDPEDAFRDLSFLDFQDYAAAASTFEGVAASQPDRTSGSALPHSGTVTPPGTARPRIGTPPSSGSSPD